VSDGSLRSLRYSLGAAVFVGSDETIVLEYQSYSTAFRRLLLQIGGTNIASADHAILGRRNSQLTQLGHHGVGVVGGEDRRAGDE
jgi:L-rhamnose isomerase